jgi:hypothetical protein
MRAQRSVLPLWQAPRAWLRLLVNLTLEPDDLAALTATSQAMCDAVLRCLDSWRLRVLVRGLAVGCTCDAIGRVNHRLL